MSENEMQAAAERLVRGVEGFAADMREQGIHVGLGSNPRCVTCGEAWPCAASQRKPSSP